MKLVLNTPFQYTLTKILLDYKVKVYYANDLYEEEFARNLNPNENFMSLLHDLEESPKEFFGNSQFYKLKEKFEKFAFYEDNLMQIGFLTPDLIENPLKRTIVRKLRYFLIFEGDF